MSGKTLKLKCRFEDEIRIAVLDSNKCFAEVHKMLSSDYGFLVKLRYQDSDGDLIVLHTQNDLDTLLQSLDTGSTVNVQVNNGAMPPPSKKEQSSPPTNSQKSSTTVTTKKKSSPPRKGGSGGDSRELDGSIGSNVSNDSPPGVMTGRGPSLTRQYSDIDIKARGNLGNLMSSGGKDADLYLSPTSSRNSSVTNSINNDSSMNPPTNTSNTNNSKSSVNASIGGAVDGNPRFATEVGVNAKKDVDGASGHSNSIGIRWKRGDILGQGAFGVVYVNT